MKKTTIHISYEEEKIAALNMYLTQKNLNVESELQAFLTKLYLRHVPENVREFVAMRSDESPEPFAPKPRRPKSARDPSAEVTAIEPKEQKRMESSEVMHCVKR